MEKLYEITLNECVAEAVMNHISEKYKHDISIVDKFAEVVDVIR